MKFPTKKKKFKIINIKKDKKRKLINKSHLVKENNLDTVKRGKLNKNLLLDFFFDLINKKVATFF